MLNVYVILISQVVEITYFEIDKLAEGLGFILSLYVGYYLVQKMMETEMFKKVEQKRTR